MLNKILCSLLALSFLACNSSTSSSGADSGKPSASEQQGQATLSFQGDLNEIKTYGKSSRTNSAVHCWQSSGMNLSEISIWSALDGTDKNIFSNWRDELKLYFSLPEFPIGEYNFNHRNRSVFISYTAFKTVQKENGSSQGVDDVFRLGGENINCTVKIAKSGGKLNLEVFCPLQSDRKSIIVSGKAECSINQL